MKLSFRCNAELPDCARVYVIHPWIVHYSIALFAYAFSFSCDGTQFID